jgi:hypothetical protein
MRLHFCKNSYNNISRKSLHCKPHSSVQTDRQTNRHDEATIRTLKLFCKKKRLKATHRFQRNWHTASHANADGNSPHRTNRQGNFKDESPNKHATQKSEIIPNPKQNALHVRITQNNGTKQNPSTEKKTGSLENWSSRHPSEQYKRHQPKKHTRWFHVVLQMCNIMHYLATSVV